MAKEAFLRHLQAKGVDVEKTSSATLAKVLRGWLEIEDLAVL
jgi:hypothetical protein